MPQNTPTPPNVNDTVIYGGSNNAASTSFDNSPSSKNSNNNSPTNSGEELTYSPEKGDKPTGDEEIARAVAFLKKKKLEPAQQRFKELQEKDPSIGRNFEDTYAQFRQMFEKIKTAWAVKHAQREISRIQDKDAPDHRGHLQEILQQRNEDDWIGMQKRKNEAANSNIWNDIGKKIAYLIPSAMTAGLWSPDDIEKVFIKNIQMRDKVKTKFPEEDSMFKPNAGLGSTNSLPQNNATNNKKNPSSQSQNNATPNTTSSSTPTSTPTPTPTPSSTPGMGGGGTIT